MPLGSYILILPILLLIKTFFKTPQGLPVVCYESWEKCWSNYFLQSVLQLDYSYSFKFDFKGTPDIFKDLKG